MSEQTLKIEARDKVIRCIFEGHPDRHLALAQIDGLIAQMMLKPDGSVDLGDDPLRQEIEAVRAALG